MREPEGPDQPSDTGNPIAVGASGRRLAALVVMLGGLAVLYGSLAEWDTCEAPCEGCTILLSLASRSGVWIGAGVVTAELGFLLAVTGLAAFRRHGASPFRIDAIVLALLALLAVAAYVVSTYISTEFFMCQPGPAVYLVAGGGALAAVASSRLRPPDRAMRAWAQARRPALALVAAGITVWSLAMTEHLGIRIEPLMYALVLIALGVGLWPSRLPATRLTPPTLGVLIVLYGACSLVVIVFGDLGVGLLEGAPIAILVGVAVLAVLELPIETPPTPATGRIDAAMAAINSTSGLMIAALLLTGATLVLLVSRQVPALDRFLRLSMIDSAPADPARLVWLLVTGLAIGAGTAIAFARRSG